jgi:hypothetical protein
VLLLSEYGITPVSKPVYINRLFRAAGWITVREELNRELLDPGASRAFAVADHQIAHIYVNDRALLPQVRRMLERTDGISELLGETGKKRAHLDHPRSGDFVAVSAPDAWFAYPYWLDDRRAPDFARTVDIHRKPGYDPAELFIDRAIRFPALKVAWTLMKKQLGFRALMELIPLNPEEVKGSHGRRIPSSDAGPILITQNKALLKSDRIDATDLCRIVLSHLGGDAAILDPQMSGDRPQTEMNFPQ